MDTLERYTLVSSLYGPGSVACWLCTLLSVLVSWTCNRHLRMKDAITNDTLAALCFPTVAAVHLIYQMTTPSATGRDIELRELITSKDPIIVRFSAAIEAPLTVCETFSTFCLLLFPIAAMMGHRKRALLAMAVGLLAFSTEFVLLVKTFKYSVFDSNFTRPFLFHFAGVMGFLFIAICSFGAALAVLALSGHTILEAIQPYIPSEARRLETARRGTSEVFATLTWLLTPFVLVIGLVFCGGSGAGLFGETDQQRLRDLVTRLRFFIPRSSATIGDLDQAFALGAGLLTLIFSAVDAIKSRRRDTVLSVSTQIL